MRFSARVLFSGRNKGVPPRISFQEYGIHGEFSAEQALGNGGMEMIEMLFYAIGQVSSSIRLHRMLNGG